MWSGALDSYSWCPSITLYYYIVQYHEHNTSSLKHSWRAPFLPLHTYAGVPVHVRAQRADEKDACKFREFQRYEGVKELWGYWSVLVVLVSCFVWSVFCCIRQLWSSSIISFNATSITCDQRTDIYSQTCIFIICTYTYAGQRDRGDHVAEYVTKGTHEWHQVHSPSYENIPFRGQGGID